jgi:hypothetical protein
MGGEIVARLFDLALVADIDPGGVEDAIHLQCEDRRIGVEPAMHAAGRKVLGEPFGRFHGFAPCEGTER